MVVTADGRSLHAEVTGEGPTLLLIQGLGYATWGWERQAPALAERFRVVAFDNRGAGRSDKPDEPYSIELLADDARAAIEQLGSAPASILGFSMGGYVALTLARRHPEAVRCARSRRDELRRPRGLALAGHDRAGVGRRQRAAAAGVREAHDAAVLRAGVDGRAPGRLRALPRGATRPPDAGVRLAEAVRGLRGVPRGGDRGRGDRDSERSSSTAPPTAWCRTRTRSCSSNGCPARSSSVSTARVTSPCSSARTRSTARSSGSSRDEGSRRRPRTGRSRSAVRRVSPAERRGDRARRAGGGRAARADRGGGRLPFRPLGRRRHEAAAGADGAWPRGGGSRRGGRAWRRRRGGGRSRRPRVRSRLRPMRGVHRRTTRAVRPGSDGERRGSAAGRRPTTSSARRVAQSPPRRLGFRRARGGREGIRGRDRRRRAARDRGPPRLRDADGRGRRLQHGGRAARRVGRRLRSRRRRPGVGHGRRGGGSVTGARRRPGRGQEAARARARRDRARSSPTGPSTRCARRRRVGSGLRSRRRVTRASSKRPTPRREGAGRPSAWASPTRRSSSGSPP